MDGIDTPLEDTLADILVSDVAEAVADADVRWLSRTLSRLHPADAADALEQLSGDDFAEAVELLGGELPPEILIELRDEYREDAVEVLPDAAVAVALDELESDDATTILEDLEDGRRERILDDLAPAERAVLEQGLSYEEDSAGRLMMREFIAAPEYWSVGHVIDHARTHPEEIPERFYEIYVVDPTYHLKGYVELSALFRMPRETELVDIMKPLESNITVDLDQEEVAYQFQKYSLASAPVKDKAGRLVGMITVDDMVDVIQEENTEDLLALSNVSSADGSDSVWDSVKARAPWLAINVMTAFIASAVISIFSDTITAIVALAILLPLVSAIGGNAGSQALAVTVRAIAEKEIEGSASRRAILRELLTGIVNGVLFATSIAGVTWFWFGDFSLSLVLWFAMFATFVWAGLSGILIPLGLKKMGADPAVASSVFVLTLTDVMAFLSFLGLATIFLL